MIKTNNISKHLSEIDVDDFLSKNRNISSSQFLLNYKGNKNKLTWYMAELLTIYRKACHKLPQFTETRCWYTAKSYEQASSEVTALLKSSLFSGKNCLDLSGGLGVDDWAFAKSFKEVISLDPDIELNEMVRINWAKLRIDNCHRIDISAEEFLSNCSTSFDLIYLDADRRSHSSRTIFLNESSPDYRLIKPLLFSLTNKILLKLSPMIDIHYLKKELLFLSQIYIISIQNEVKEILALIEPDSLISNVEIIAIEITDGGNQQSFSAEITDDFSVSSIDQPSYFFEPSPAIIKAGLAIAYANHLKLFQLGKNTAFYVGLRPIDNFIGRSFKIIKSFKFSKSTLLKYLQQNNILKANVTKRSFNLSVDELRKVFKIKEGGNDYLFFATLHNKERMVYHCEKDL